MKIYSVYSKKFREYGRVINDSFDDILEVLKDTELPEGVAYVPSYKPLEDLKSFKVLRDDYYGGMPIQLGYCNGHNHKLNCLEYHLDSEINLANEEFILLLGLRSQIVDGVFDTKNVKAFLVPPKVAVEVFATSLHYAPCRQNGLGFQVLIVLPKGTNTENIRSDKEPMLYMTNKWLLAHPESDEAKSGAYIGLKGKNITI